MSGERRCPTCDKTLTTYNPGPFCYTHTPPSTSRMSDFLPATLMKDPKPEKETKDRGEVPAVPTDVP